MAVVFISPKQRQKMFFMGITIMFLLFLAVTALSVFLAKPQEVSPALVFNKPKVNIDFSVVDSEQFKNLESFAKMETQFSYKAVAEKGKIVTGLVSAVSIDEAKNILEGIDLTVTEIKEVEPGRDNPFIPYFQEAATPAKK